MFLKKFLIKQKTLKMKINKIMKMQKTIKFQKVNLKIKINFRVHFSNKHKSITIIYQI